MPAPVTEFDSASNKAAEADTRSKPATAALYAEAGVVDPAHEGDGFTPTDTVIVHMMKAAVGQGLQYMQTSLSSRWQSAHRAYNNQHFEGSKYLSARWRGRSRLFRPKTRAAVRRKAAEAAQALFTTPDLVSVTAQDPDNQEHQAAAAINQALLQYRLDRSSENTGIPWFSIAMGAHQAAQLTGLCVAKVYWDFKEEVVAVQKEVFLEADGRETTEETPVVRTVKDRPRVRLLPIENVIRDPAAAWEDQAQESSYCILQFPVPFHELRAMVMAEPRQGSRVVYRDIDEDTLRTWAGLGGSQTAGNDTAGAVRRARDTSTRDRYEDAGEGHADFRTVWLHENFMKINGTDWHWWSISRQHILTNPAPVIDAYPEQGGARPIIIGMAALEPFKIDPMSPVESWQPLQQEMNDLVNLRLDTVKQTVSPVTLVRRGRQIDLNQVQNRSPDSVIYQNEKDDVMFDRPGDVSASSYAEMEKLNADFDDQAGIFGIGTVQTNRQLGETVGGMKLVSGTANAMGEFDLRVWIETFVEPVFRQVIKAEQFYETDATVLALAGKKAQLFKKFGVSEIDDELLSKQLFVRVNAGLGAFDPMQRLAKMRMAFETLGMILGPQAQQRLKQDEVIKSVMGAAGEGDGERFFYEGDDQDPRIQSLAQQLQQATGMIEDKDAERTNKIQLKRMDIAGQLLTKMVGTQTDMQRDAQGNRFKAQEGERGRQFDAQKIRQAQRHEGQQAQSAQQNAASTADQAHKRQVEIALIQSLLDPARLPSGEQSNASGAGPLTPAPQPMAAPPGAGSLPSAPSSDAGDILGIGQILQQMAMQNQQSQERMAMMLTAAMSAMSQQIAQAMSAPRRLVRMADGSKAAVPMVRH